MNYTNNKRILIIPGFSYLPCLVLWQAVEVISDDNDSLNTKPPQLSPAVGVKMTGSCPDLLGFQYNNTVISRHLQEAH
jgi:feruloyl esterase